jgi:hypothetical protein
MKKLSVKSWLINTLSESEDKNVEKPKFSPDNVGSISTVQIKPERGIIIIDFITKDKRNAKLKTKDNNFYNWLNKNQESTGNRILNFLIWFLKSHQPSENKVMSEIVDEYNGLIGDEDMPRDSERMIGLSSKDSTQAVYQTRAKGWNNFNTGAISGFVSW